jgi:hypothetical protein
MFILRVRNGRDFFVSVEAVYKISDSGWCITWYHKISLHADSLFSLDFYEMPAEEAGPGPEATSASFVGALATGVARSRSAPRDDEDAFHTLGEDELPSRSVSADQPRTRIGKFKAAAASMKSRAEDRTENIRNAIGAFSKLKVFDDKRTSSKSEWQHRASSFI